MRSTITLYFTCLLMLSNINCKESNPIDDEVNIYSHILPLLINKEYLLQVQLPSPPPLGEVVNDMQMVNNINELEDSIYEAHQSKWMAHFDSTEKVLAISDLLLGSRSINSFVLADVEFFSKNGNETVYNKLVKGAIRDKIINVNDIKSPTGYSFIRESTDILIDSEKYFIGYITLSRISLNNKSNLGCFFVQYETKNRLQGFEMFVLIKKQNSNWKIEKTTRDGPR